MDEWFVVQTTDLHRRQLSRSLVGQCPGSWWAAQFGREAKFAPPPVVDTLGQLKVDLSDFLPSVSLLPPSFCRHRP